MITEKLQKKYACHACDYFTSNKSNWNKHVLTSKHANGNNGNRKVAKGNRFVCHLCGKKYKFMSGLSRHKKSCNLEKKKNKKKTKKTDLSEIYATMKELIKDNQKKTELLEKMIDENKKLIPVINNKISIHVFLNEHCKNAMNMTDFIDGINVSLDDLNYTNQYGYVKGISNIFVKHLTDLKATERPIHCSDKKRLQFYIKDENKWEKDNSHEKINKTIQDITIKQIKQVREWERENPNYMENDALREEWHNMIREIMGGSENVEREKNNESIKKGISDTVSVKNALSN